MDPLVALWACTDLNYNRAVVLNVAEGNINLTLSKLCRAL